MMRKAIRIMRKSCIFLSCAFLLIGCAVHKFQKSEKLSGYVVARFGYVIPEYTSDIDNKAPQNLELAKQRYKRRKDMVEKLYIKMGQVEDYVTRYVTHFPKMMWSIFANTLKMPLHIISEYRYEHNEQYRKRIDELDARTEAKEDARIKQFKDQLYEFIRQDIEKEKPALNASPQ